MDYLRSLAAKLLQGYRWLAVVYNRARVRPVGEVRDDDPGTARFAARPARKLDARAHRWVPRPTRRRAVRGRPVEPDLPAPLRRRFLRAAAQAAWSALTERPCGRPRIPGDARSRRHEGAGAEGLRAVRRRCGHPQRLLCDGVSRRPDLLGPAAAGPRPGRTPGDVPIDERGHRRTSFSRLRRCRARRVRPSGQLHGAPGRALEPAIPGLGDGTAAGDGPADRMAAMPPAAGG